MITPRPGSTSVATCSIFSHFVDLSLRSDVLSLNHVFSISINRGTYAVFVIMCYSYLMFYMLCNLVVAKH